ncbi:MAG: hypothetical protein HFI75_14190 [Lachnospiraceae bacterium]|nr:hypothetical protein [Lachnospiraceae bacterium]
MRFIMKCLAALLLLAGWSTNTEAAQIPLDMTAEYSESQQEVLITILAKEPVVLNAYTFAVTYNKEIYELYRGNDCIVNGYGYTASFQESYQARGMTVCNAIENQVLFSGVNTDDSAVCQGSIAQISLLKYNSGASSDLSKDVNLKVTSLYINGEKVDLTEPEPQPPSQIQQVEQIVYPQESIGTLPEKNPNEDSADQNPAAEPTDDKIPQPSEDNNTIDKRAADSDTTTAAAGENEVSTGGSLTKEYEDGSNSQQSTLTGDAILSENLSNEQKEISKAAAEKELSQPEHTKKDNSRLQWPFVAAITAVLIIIIGSFILILHHAKHQKRDSE